MNMKYYQCPLDFGSFFSRFYSYNEI